MKRNGKLRRDPKNARKHGEANKAMIRESLEAVGPLRSIGVDGDNIIRAGNGVFEQAEALGLRVRVVDAKPNELIAVRRPDLKGKKAVEAALYDNRTGETSEWDTDVLAEMARNDGDLVKRLFEGDREIMAAIAPQPEPQDAEPQIDRAEELQKKWRVQLGDIFKMGDHAIICGDCREPDTWKRLLGAAGVEKVNGVFTSPPYAEQRKAQYGGVPTDKYVEWWEAVQANVRENLARDGSFFVNIKENSEDGKHSLYVFDLVCAMVRGFDWQYRDDYRWIHTGVPGNAEMMHRFKNQHEPVFWFSASDGFKFRPLEVRHESNGAVLVSPKNPGLERTQGKHRHALFGAVIGTGWAFPGNVLSVGKNMDVESTGGHVAAFPVALPSFFVRAYSDTGDTWLDPFCGSGTTIVAAANNKRRGLGIELLPKYCAVILERMATAFQGIEIQRIDGNEKKARKRKATPTARK